MGAAGEPLDELGDGLGFNLRSAGIVFPEIYRKSEISIFRLPSRTESLFLQVPAPKLEPLGQKSRARSVQKALREGSGQSSLAGRFSLAVKAMEIIGNQPRRKSRQRPKSI